jgi:hypothetical protein
MGPLLLAGKRQVRGLSEAGALESNAATVTHGSWEYGNTDMHSEQQGLADFHFIATEKHEAHCISSKLLYRPMQYEVSRFQDFRILFTDIC